MNQKKLLLLGGAHYLRPVIREAHALGLYVITCDYLPDNTAHKLSDQYLNISILDKDKVLDAAKELQIDGVMSFACDPGVVTAAYVAEKLGLPYPASYESTCILQDKGRFRAFLRDNGFTVPWAHSYTDKQAALHDAKSFTWPCIVKPVDCAGSKGVRRVDSSFELEAAIDYALDFSHSAAFIIEQFITQRGYSSDTDCFVKDGVLCYCSFDEQRFDREAENPYTPAAYSWPSSMPPEIQAELKSELQRLMTLLGITTGVFNIETRQGTDGRAYIMECTPRGGGNRLSEVLEMATGTKLVQNAVRAAVGLPVDDMSDPVYKGHWAEIILHSRQAGAYQSVQIAPEVMPFVVQEDYWVSPGEEIERFSGANKAIGTLVLNFPDRETLEKYMSDDSWYRVIVS
ncbi:MAG: ATP-grasp domain-containing protein [Oscillospiraceae bacterium]|nr:ATP-grasp domain-containing protein [Oscillospiraceae bacterium]